MSEATSPRSLAPPPPPLAPSPSEIQRKLGSPTSIPITLSTSASESQEQELQRRLSTASRRVRSSLRPRRTKANKRAQQPHGSFSSVGATSMMSSSAGGMSSADEDEPVSPNRPTLPLSAISEASDGGASGTDSDASSLGGGGSPRANTAARLVEKLRISRESTRLSESVAVKSGYLMKKGERRKAWKKRWFVLRGGQMAMYKSDKEYRLLRLIPLTEIHTCSPILLKKHQAHTFGIVTPKRTYYVKAASEQEMHDWCTGVERAKQEVKAAATTNSNDGTTPQATAPPTPAVQSPTPADTPVQSPQRSAAIPIPSIPSSSSAFPPSSSYATTTTSSPPASSSVLSSSYTSSSSADLARVGPAVPPNSFAVAGAGALGLQGSDGEQLELGGVDRGLERAVAAGREKQKGRTPSEGALAVPAGGQQGYFSRPRGTSTASGNISASGGGMTSPGGGGVSSSEDEDGFEGYDHSWVTPQPTPGGLTFVENKPVHPQQSVQTPKLETSGGSGGFGDPNKVILSGYLMKQGKRKNWRKRWFVLMSGRLMYSRSHMDTKIHRQIPLARILDAIEYDASASTSSASRRPLSTSSPLPSSSSAADVMPSTSPAAADRNYEHCFKIITPKRTYLVCAPSEEDEIKWLAALQCLVARKNQPQPSTPALPSPAGGPPALAPPIQSPSLPAASTAPPAVRRTSHSSHAEGESRFGHHTRQRSVTDAARAAVRDVERRFHPLAPKEREAAAVVGQPAPIAAGQV